MYYNGEIPIMNHEHLERAFYKLNQEYLDVATDLTYISIKPEASETESLEEATKRFEDTLIHLEEQSKFYGVSIEAIVNGILRLYIEKYQDDPEALKEEIKKNGIKVPTKKPRKMKALK